MTSTQKKPRRRWFQYRLRSLLILTLVAGVWLGIVAKRARDQHRAVEALRAPGGEVYYDYHFDDKEEFLKDPQPSGPAWLRNLLGDDFFCDVVEVHLRDCDLVTDADLAHVRSLPKLRVLLLGGTKISDAGLRHVAGLRRLKWLELSHSKITDNGLAHVAGLTSLTGLHLYGTRSIGDKGLAHLRHLKNLESLFLDDLPLTDQGLDHLTGLTRLRELGLSGTSVSNAGLSRLQRLQNLTHLWLHGTAIDDAGLAQLKRRLPRTRIAGP